MLLKYWPQKTNLSFMNLRLIGAVVSAVLIASSIFFLAMRGLNFGVDFAGGTVMELEQTDTITVEGVRQAMPLNADVNSAVGTDARSIVVVKYGEADASILGEEFQALSATYQAERATGATTELVTETLKE
ncbi:unnamed protein product, partial [Scytosiphon promiscuus]